MKYLLLGIPLKNGKDATEYLSCH